MENIDKIAENIIAVDRALMRKVENFILSADKETLEHIEKFVNLRKDQLKKTSN